jgi:hypothetical protein
MWFEIIRLFTSLSTFVYFYWLYFFSPSTSNNTYERAYFLSDTDEYDESYTRVPEGAVYIEEWVDKESGEKLCYVHYEGEDILVHENPFQLPRAKCPWTWIGDMNSEIDLTKTFKRYLIPGNRIELDLVMKLIHITEFTNLQYLTAEMNFENFPGDGILIESNE